MRFRVIDRILLVLLLIFIIALSAALIGIALGLMPSDAIVYYVTLLTDGTMANRLIAAGAGVILLLLALRLFIALTKRRVQPKPTSALVLSGDNGSAYVALAAIDAMVQRHCRANARVRECESTISTTGGGITIALKLALLNDTNMPELIESLQASLKEYIETYSGIKVINVEMLIINAPAQQRPQVL